MIQANTSNAYLRLENVTKSYGDGTAVSGVHLTAREGELVSLLGPSGCGKTTTLRIIAGFLAPDAGDIIIGGKSVAGVPSHKRNTAVVFQSYALFPHMSVLDNVEFGLRMRRVIPSERRQRAEEALDLVRLPSETRNRFPGELSGGQQQRVALARALVVRPQLLLLDEPLSNLDAKLRKQLRVELREIHDRAGTTTVFVTHDLEEAFEVSDRIAVMDRGRIEQIATPAELYQRPASPFVADFVGHPNILRGVVTASPDGPEFIVEDSGLRVRLSEQAAAEIRVVILPEQRLRVSDEPVKAENVFKARPVHSSYRGMLTHLVLEECETGQRLEAHVDSDVLRRVPEGQPLHLGWDRHELIAMEATP